MFRVYIGDNKYHYNFYTHNAFSDWRVRMAAAGYKVYYSHMVKKHGVYIYCYQLRRDTND